MGDVFDAMNRAKREKTQATPAAGAGGKPDDVSRAMDSAGDEKPALPIGEIESAAVARRQETDDRPMSLTGSTPAEPVAKKPQPQQPAPSREFVASEPAKPATDVSVAAAKSRVERAANAGAAAAASVTHAHDPSLNGYSDKVIAHHDRGSALTEQYRAIRTQILARARSRRLQVHVLTSSAPEEGKSVTTMNLGMVFSELRNLRCLLVEGDLRRPTFHKLLDKTLAPGLIQVLRGEVTDIDKAIHPTVYENLQVMPAGDREFVSSTELLSSPRMAQLLERLRDKYDHIFIDTPPVVTVTDACILGAMADETILVVRLNKTPTAIVDRAKRLLRAANCEVAGVILTHMDPSATRYGYAYTYRYA